jgi:TolB-like protein/Flp pilus assembly protein TadD
VRSFIEALASAGGRAAAIRVCERFAALLRQELGVEPSAEIRAALARIAAVEPEARSGAPAASSRGDGRPSVAVLPFLVPGGDEDAGYFGIGVMDDILARLTRVKGLRVTSRTSSMHAAREAGSVREVARELGVRNVLEGSVRRSEGRVRVVAQLIDAETDDHVWAESYDRELGDLFEVQTDIAERIAWALRAELSQEELASVRRIPTQDLAAWDRYVRAIQAYQDFEPVGLNEALRYLGEAVSRDPGFAKAWALSGQVRVFLGLCAEEPPSAYFPKVRHEAERALALDAGCGEAHAAMGMLRLFHEWDPAGAREEFSRALALNGDDPLALGWRAILLTLEGDTTDGVTFARQGILADPLSAAAHMVLGQVLVMAEQPDEAVRGLEAACRMWPNALQVRMWLGLAHMMCGRPEAALEHYDWAVERSGGMAHFEALRATALVALGRAAEARAILDDLHTRSRRGYVDPYSIFTVTLLLDGPAAALPHLEEMLEARSLFLPYLRGIPRFRALRQHPRFREVIDRVWAGPPVGAS